MIVFTREVFVCRCSTTVPDRVGAEAELNELAQRLAFRRGTEADLPLVEQMPREESNVPQAAYLADMRERLARGDYWMIGADGDRIVTYTWLHMRRAIDYPYLPGCVFETATDVGYGYDAWTPPELRGGGLRRRAFLEELRILKSMGAQWEASFFVKHQLEGAQRSLGKVGIVIEPLWRVKLGANRTLTAERLADNDSTKPAFGANPAGS